MTEKEKYENNIRAATKLLAVILATKTDEKEIEQLLNDYLEGVKLNWTHTKNNP